MKGRDDKDLHPAVGGGEPPGSPHLHFLSYKNDGGRPGYAIRQVFTDGLVSVRGSAEGWEWKPTSTPHLLQNLSSDLTELLSLEFSLEFGVILLNQKYYRSEKQFKCPPADGWTNKMSM